MKNVDRVENEIYLSNCIKSSLPIENIADQTPWIFQNDQSETGCGSQLEGGMTSCDQLIHPDDTCHSPITPG